MNLVHVLHTSNDRPLKPELLELLTRRLPIAMQSHVRKFSRWQDYQASLFGKLLLYDGLVNGFGLGARVLEDVVLTEYLKPILPTSDLYFSVAHSGSLVACAVGNIPLGIDVERFRSAEIEDFRECLPALIEKEDGQEVDLLACWTMAEAILKASGEGLRHSMKEISIKPSRGQAAFRSREWNLSKLILREGYRSYLATAGPAVIVTEYQPPSLVTSLTHSEKRGLEHETIYGL